MRQMAVKEAQKSLPDLLVWVSVGENVVIKGEDGTDYRIIPVKRPYTLKTLPFHHKDPFDRLIISQGIAENIPVLSQDEMIDYYENVKRIW